MTHSTPSQRIAAARACHIDASQRELDRRNAEGEPVDHLRVCDECGSIIPLLDACRYCKPVRLARSH